MKPQWGKVPTSVPPRQSDNSKNKLCSGRPCFPDLRWLLFTPDLHTPPLAFEVERKGLERCSTFPNTKKKKSALCESGTEETFQGPREIDDTARGRGGDPEPKKHQRLLDVRGGTDSMRSPLCIAPHFSYRVTQAPQSARRKRL